MISGVMGEETDLVPGLPAQSRDNSRRQVFSKIEVRDIHQKRTHTPESDLR